MRQIFLDTETTGLEHKLGHRVIEIGCVEMRNRRLTNRHFHRYINPERDIDAGALAVHGISLEFLQDKPKFADIAEEFLDFVRGAELIIHNASFDIGFLNAELALLAGGTAWVVLQLSSLLLPAATLGQWEPVRDHLLLWIAAVVALLVAWFGPGAGVHREGARSLVAALLPYRPMRFALGVLSLLLGLGFAVATVTGSFPAPVWQPLPTPTWLVL